MDQVVFKAFGWFINLDKILLFLLVVGVLFLYTRWWRGGRRFMVLATSLLLLTTVVPTGYKILSFLENRFPQPMEIQEDVKGIIILGGSFDLQVSVARQKTCYNLAAGRIIEFLQVAHKYPHLPVLFSGAGAVDNPYANESANMQKLLESLGFDMSRVHFENKSKTTIENAKLSYELVKPAPGDKWLLVTSAYHMPRSVGLFRGAGWNVIPYPVDYHFSPEVSWFDFNYDLSKGIQAWAHGIREIGGMSTNYLAGRTKEWISSP